MGTVIGCVIFSVIAILCFVFSYLQFKERGFLFNNAYLYASKQEREKMDKTPYYKQSGIVFFLLGIIFLSNAVDILLHTGWLFYGIITLVIAVIVYAIVSSARINKKANSRTLH